MDARRPLKHQWRPEVLGALKPERQHAPRRKLLFAALEKLAGVKAVGAQGLWLWHCAKDEVPLVGTLKKPPWIGDDDRDAGVREGLAGYGRKQRRNPFGQRRVYLYVHDSPGMVAQNFRHQA